MICTKTIAQSERDRTHDLILRRMRLDAEAFCEKARSFFERQNLSVFYFADMTDMMAELAFVKLYSVFNTNFDVYDFPVRTQVCFSKVPHTRYTSHTDAAGVTIYPYDTEEHITEALRSATSKEKLQKDCVRIQDALQKKDITVRWSEAIPYISIRNTLYKLSDISNKLDLSCFKNICIDNDYSDISQKGVAIKAHAPVEELTVFLENTIKEIQKDLAAENTARKKEDISRNAAFLKQQGFSVESNIANTFLLWQSLREVANTFSLLQKLGTDATAKIRRIRIVVSTASGGPVQYHEKESMLDIAAHATHLQLSWFILGLFNGPAEEDRKERTEPPRTEQSHNAQKAETGCPIDPQDEKNERKKIKERITSAYIKDPYFALDILPSDTKESATRRYKFLMIMFHPDKTAMNGDMDNLEISKQINQAWETIKKRF